VTKKDFKSNMETILPTAMQFKALNVSNRTKTNLSMEKELETEVFQISCLGFIGLRCRVAYYPTNRLSAAGIYSVICDVIFRNLAVGDSKCHLYYKMGCTEQRVHQTAIQR
jgi:hypothetical protein